MKSQMSKNATMGIFNNIIFSKGRGGNVKAVLEIVKLVSMLKPPTIIRRTHKMAVEEGVEVGIFDHINIPINPNNILLNCLVKTASLALIFSRILPVRIDSFVAKTSAPMPQAMPMSEYC